MALKQWILKKLAKRELGKLRKETNMSKAAKVLRFLDGWKLLIGVAILFGSKVFDGLSNGHSGDLIGSILSALGWLPTGAGLDAQTVTVAAASGIALWGFFSKLIKAQRQLKAGAAPSELLSNAGHLADYVVNGRQ